MPEPRVLSRDALLAGLVIAFVAVATGYSVMIPAGEGVDEIPHFNYVRYVKEHRALPVQPMTAEQGAQVWMGHHPPLYYILGALSISWCDTADFAAVLRRNPHFVWRENDGSDGWNAMLHFGQDRFPWKGSVLALHTVRLMTVGLGAIAVYAIYRAAERMFPGHQWIPMGVAAVVAFNPSFVLMCSTVHHDALQATIFSLTIWQCMAYLSRPGRRWDALAFGALSGLAMLTKLSGLGLLAVVTLALFLKAQQDRNWPWHLRQLLYTLGTAALVAGWWFIRNQRLYGDPLGWQMFLNTHAHMVRRSPYTWQAFSGFVAQIGRTFWGAFGYMHITFPHITAYLWWLTGFACIGAVAAIARRQATVRERSAEWAVTLSVLLVLFASFIRFSIATVGAGHGRYLLPASFSIGALLIVGLNGLSSLRYQHLTSVVLTLGMLAYAIWLPVRFVLPKYAPPATATAEQLARATPLQVQLADGVELVGYHTGETADADPDAASRVLPGQRLPVGLYWRASGEPADRQDPRVRLALVDEQGEAVVWHTMWPVPSLSPDVWAPGETYVTRADLRLPAGELPPEISLTVRPVLEGASEQSDDGRVYLERMVTTGGVSQVEPGEAPHTRQEVFASELRLLGHEVSPDVIKPGDSFTIDLYWEVLEKPPADYTVFIHVLDDRDELVTQFDRPAGGGTAPTSTWRTGQTLRDAYPLALPEGIGTGTYTVRMGMYAWPSMERIPVSVEGRALENNLVDLCTLRVGP